MPRWIFFFFFWYFNGLTNLLNEISEHELFQICTWPVTGIIFRKNKPFINIYCVCVCAYVRKRARVCDHREASVSVLLMCYFDAISNYIVRLLSSFFHMYAHPTCVCVCVLCILVYAVHTRSLAEDHCNYAILISH